MNQKLLKLRDEQEKVRLRITEHNSILEKLKAKEKEFSRKIEELNNSEILAIAKAHNLTPESFAEMFEKSDSYELPDEDSEEYDEDDED